jgi:short-subunit dehydrogenase
LVGRRQDRTSAVAADLLARGAASTETFAADLAAIDTIEPSWRTLHARFGDPDEAVIAYSILGDQAASVHDLAAVRSVLDTNFTSAALVPRRRSLW